MAESSCAEPSWKLWTIHPTSSEYAPPPLRNNASPKSSNFDLKVSARVAALRISTRCTVRVARLRLHKCDCFEQELTGNSIKKPSMICMRLTVNFVMDVERVLLAIKLMLYRLCFLFFCRGDREIRILFRASLKYLSTYL